MGGAAGHRDVPARQPPRQRFRRVHVDLVLRGAEARAGADRVPAPLPARPRADRGGAARGALRVRPGAGARDADAALLRRDPPQPLVPPRGRMAHRAGDPADLRADLAGRGAPRRRVPALHEARDRALRRRGAARVREDRRADGERQSRRASRCIRPTCTSTSTLFPRDTVQSRLPDPAWLERWLDQQIHFDRRVGEQRVIDA